MRKWVGRSLPDKSRITSVFHIWRLPRDWKYRFNWYQPVQLVINSSLPRNTAEPAWSWWKFIKKRKNFDIFKNGKKLLANQRSKIRTLLNNNNILKISVFSKCYGVKILQNCTKHFSWCSERISLPIFIEQNTSNTGKHQKYHSMHSILPTCENKHSKILRCLFFIKNHRKIQILDSQNVCLQKSQTFEFFI